MKYLTVVVIAILMPFSMTSQTYEIGIMAGGSNFIGDVGATTYIAPNSLALGGIAKWNRSSRHAFRFSALFTTLKGDDGQSHETRRQLRNYDFENITKEFSLGLEYNFWDYNLYSGGTVSVPYLYSGITYLLHEELVLSSFNQLIKADSGGSFAIPIVLGYKMAFLDAHLMLALELGARYTLSDNLDGSAPDEGLNAPSFGNLNNNDWYMFTGFTLTYTFGRQPCYCGF